MPHLFGRLAWAAVLFVGVSRARMEHGYAAEPQEGSRADEADAEQRDERVRSFLARHCFECHAVEKPKGDFRLDHPEVESGHDSIFSFLTAAPHPQRRAGFRNSISIGQVWFEHGHISWFGEKLKGTSDQVTATSSKAPCQRSRRKQVMKNSLFSGNSSPRASSPSLFSDPFSCLSSNMPLTVFNISSGRTGGPGG